MKKQITNIYKTLLKSYGTQGWWPLNSKYIEENTTKELTEEEKFEIILGAILTQNSSWKNVETSLNNLRKHNLLNKNNIQKTTTEKLANLIKSSGYYNQKARKIKIFCNWLNSKEELNRENLLKIWGIGPETVDSILLYSYRKPIFVIDAYTKRIFSRLGLLKEKETYENIQELFMSNLKKDHKLFNEFHALIVEHAKQKCKTKPQCSSCCLKRKCKLYSQI